METVRRFSGIVVQSKENTFVAANGETVTTWLISLLLNDERGINFNVSPNDEPYDEVQNLKIGDEIIVNANAEVRNDGRVKWRMQELNYKE